jgi:hypothetical protein
MKIISLSSSIAGPACAVAKSIKKYFYNNNYQTNMFDYLEISLLSILQILFLKKNDINYLNLNNEIYLNNSGNNSIKLNNFDKIISHHDLKISYTDDDYNNVINKYIRRYHRLIHDIENEDKIFLIRYGIEEDDIINKLINKLLLINPLLKIFIIIVDYNEDNKDNKIYNDKNYVYINFYNYIENIKYNDDLFYKIMQFNWKIVYYKIYENLNLTEKENFKYYD